MKCSFIFSDLYILKTCWNFQFFLIIRQRDVIFFLNFQTYQENILKKFNYFWKHNGTPNQQAVGKPKSSSVAKRAFTSHTKGFENPQPFMILLGLPKLGLYHWAITTQPYHGNIITTLYKSCWFLDPETNIRPTLH